MNLQTATPAEIDTELAAIQRRVYAVQDEIDGYETFKANTIKNHADPRRFNRYDTDAQHADRIAKLDKQIATATAQRTMIEAEMAPYAAEFEARGGWTRAWLVNNNGGHVHTSMYCHQCYPTTRFVWLPEQSGKTELEIIKAAGSMACTTCYVGAPTEYTSVKGTIEDPERKAAREARDTAKAARDAKKAAAGISNPDGSPLRGRWGVIATERTAQIEATDARVDVWRMVVELGKADAPRDASHYASLAVEYGKTLAGILPALAHKRGTTIEEQAELIDRKAEQKIKRDWGQKVTL